MTAAATQRFIEAARIVREHEAVYLKDKGYQQFPIGREAAGYLAALEWEGRPSTTISAYEVVYDRLARRYPDYPGLAAFCEPLGRDEIRRFLADHWGKSKPNTRSSRHSELASLFKWATEEGLIPYNPMAGMRAPRGRSEIRRAHAPARLLNLIRAQDNSRDRAALTLLWPMGLRRNELRLIRLSDVDLHRNLLLVHGKGQKDAVLPLAVRLVRDELTLHLMEREPRPNDYLLYPKRDTSRPMDTSSVDRWFKRCLANAGMRPIPMHELRHSSGDALWRATGNIVLAQQLLRHSSVGTTQTYLHPSMDDLAAGLRHLETTIEET